MSRNKTVAAACLLGVAIGMLYYVRNRAAIAEGPQQSAAASI